MREPLLLAVGREVGLRGLGDEVHCITTNLERLRVGGRVGRCQGDELTKRQLSDMDPITMMMANAGLGIRSPESDAYLRAAFDRGIVNQQSHRNAAAVASQVGRRVWKG